MNTIIAGVVFIIGTVAGILSIVPVIDAPDYLIKASTNAKKIIIGAIFQLSMAAAYVGFTILLYPILSNYNEGLAVGFVGFNFIAGIFNIIGVISLLLLLALSQKFIKAGTLDSSYFQKSGKLLRTVRDLVNHVAMILAKSLGGLMFLFILYQSKLVPLWLTGWGFVGLALTITASLLLLFRLIKIKTPTYIILNLPLALQEQILAGWLIVVGFNV